MKIIVRSGDSLWYYSQLFMVPLNLIIDSNPNINPSALQIGQEVQIPGFSIERYSVKRGDTFWKLSAGRHLSADALLLLNQNINPNQLVIGSVINLPKRMIAPSLNRRMNYTFESLQTDLTSLKGVFPFIQINTIGNSVLGKPIQEIKIGTGPKKVQINASFHANEWITTPILMALVNNYLLALTNMRPIRGLDVLPYYQNVSLSIVPMVNPDGVNLVLKGPPAQMRDQVLQINNGSTDFSGWKANIRGVDLNNQYPAKWEVEKERKEEKTPAPRDFPGTAPLTEPEAVAMAEFARENQFDRMLAFHTQGEEFYWGYEGLEPPESQVIADEFERVSGYTSVQYIDSFAGYKDWFVQEFRKPGFTIELGKGINPLPLSQFDEIYEEVLGIFLASLYM
ncbi:M14 family metallopeptidase [Cytobacillus gottheilii]|uniref:LysM peptidoglycan-binding domain-containing protein n=1 Tax=Cytobacillus gottheilii TaxID=859144 RepID=A0ABX8F7A5_9BACI|nr:M14 family metallopeptidase [Cytobacillus gottheilii]QVY60335.1 LysM peptidoglycan-binding domain-containing protein [Cytobacillus gottheilii]